MKIFFNKLTLFLCGVFLIFMVFYITADTKDYHITITDKLEVGCNHGKHACYNDLILVGTVRETNTRISLSVTPVSFVDAVIGKEYIYNLREDRVVEPSIYESLFAIFGIIIGGLMMATSITFRIESGLKND